MSGGSWPGKWTGRRRTASLLADGQPLEFVRKGTGTLAVAGYYYPADDGGNTRLAITGAQSFVKAPRTRSGVSGS